MLVKAKFIGESSLGFVNGVTYTLNIEFGFKLAFLNKIECFSIRIETNSGSFPEYKKLRCDYQKLSTFLSLWKILSIHYLDKDLSKKYASSNFKIQDYYDNEIVGNFQKNMRNSKIEILLDENYL